MAEIDACVCRDRPNAYGDAEENFDDIAKLASVVLRKKLNEPLTALDVALFSKCIKFGRVIANPMYLDNHIDDAGYSVCAAGIVKSILEKQASSHQYDIRTLGDHLVVGPDDAFNPNSVLKERAKK